MPAPSTLDPHFQKDVAPLEAEFKAAVSQFRSSLRSQELRWADIVGNPLLSSEEVVETLTSRVVTAELASQDQRAEERNRRSHVLRLAPNDGGVTGFTSEERRKLLTQLLPPGGPNGSLRLNEAPTARIATRTELFHTFRSSAARAIIRGRIRSRLAILKAELLQTRVASGDSSQTPAGSFSGSYANVPTGSLRIPIVPPIVDVVPGVKQPACPPPPSAVLRDPSVAVKPILPLSFMTADTLSLQPSSLPLHEALTSASAAPSMVLPLGCATARHTEALGAGGAARRDVTPFAVPLVLPPGASGASSPTTERRGHAAAAAAAASSPSASASAQPPRSGTPLRNGAGRAGRERPLGGAAKTSVPLSDFAAALSAVVATASPGGPICAGVPASSWFPTRLGGGDAAEGGAPSRSKPTASAALHFSSHASPYDHTAMVHIDSLPADRSGVVVFARALALSSPPPAMWSVPRKSHGAALFVPYEGHVLSDSEDEGPAPHTGINAAPNGELAYAMITGTKPPGSTDATSSPAASPSDPLPLAERLTIASADVTAGPWQELLDSLKPASGRQYL